MHRTGVLESSAPRHESPPDAQPFSANTMTITPTPPVFDEAGLVKRMGDDHALTRLILDGFVTDIPHQLDALREYLDAGDVYGAERKAHAIKGASGTVSAEALRATAAEVEAFVKTGHLAAAKARLDTLDARFAAFHAALRQAGYVV